MYCGISKLKFVDHFSTSFLGQNGYFRYMFHFDHVLTMYESVIQSYIVCYV